MKTLYICDPDKNTECPKTDCQANAGLCKYTSKPQYAKQPIERICMVLPKEEDDESEGI